MVPGLLLINYALSYLAKYLEIVGVKNTLPFSLNIESQYLYGIFLFIIAFLVGTRLLNKHPLSTSFVVAGAFYNLLERSIYGHVFDFIKITWGYINLADLMLWFGLILLNYEIWFNVEDEFAPLAYASVLETRDVEPTPTQELKSIPLNLNTSTQAQTPTPIQKPIQNQTQAPAPKVEPTKPIEHVHTEVEKNDILKSFNTSKIKTVTDLLNKVKSSDSQSIVVPKLDYKPKKIPVPRIKVS